MEIIKEFDAIGQPVLTPEVAYKAIPGIEGDKFYMLISRKAEFSAALKTMLDKGVAKLRVEGKLDAFLQSYLK